ncbi:MAG: hypothetical protein K8W52_42385 [Deltaproteobacteria bacterium]|nr:hypothetical protein [Deltaproteobacteria bacterium]
MRIAIASLVIALGSAAHAGPCDDALVEPLGLGVRDARFDRGISPCVRDELGASVDGGATIDTPGFYGTLAGALRLDGRIALDLRIELGVAARVLDATFVQTAVIKVTELGYGPLEAHVSYGDDASFRGRPLRWAAIALVDVPWTQESQATRSGGAQLALAATWALSPRWTIAARVAGLGWYASSLAGVTGRAAGALDGEAIVRAARRVALGLGIDAQAGWYGAGLDHVLVRIGARVRVAARWRLELIAGAPIAGAERADVTFTLGVRRGR